MVCVFLPAVMICCKSSCSAGQKSGIPEALVMGEELAAPAEEAGKARIWNKLQVQAEEFAQAFKGKFAMHQVGLCTQFLNFM